MDIHYKAFISYRHHPDDIRVAAEIHKSLECFKEPKSIKKRSTPMCLFRDKEELPITSHLTDDISLALENSDFLIVICSPTPGNPSGCSGKSRPSSSPTAGTGCLYRGQAGQGL